MMSQFSQNNPVKKPSHKNRGFFALLAVCLVIVGGLGVVTLVDTLSPSDNDSATGTTTVRPAGNALTGVQDARTTRTTHTTTTTTTTTAAPTEPVNVEPADLFILPLSNEVSAPYSLTPVYSSTMEDWRLHRGVDFRGTAGQEVKALADGTVQDVYEDMLWGSCLTLDHGGGVISTYCGVQSAVIAGDTVRVGQVIGTLTVIPCECREEAHLHLEMRANGVLLDPVEALGREVRYSEP